MLLFYSLYSCCIFCLQCFDPVGWVQEEHPACKKEWWVAGVATCRFVYSPDDASWTTRWAGTRRNIHPLTSPWSSNVPYLLHPSAQIRGILPVQSTCLTVFFHCLSPSFLWSVSWPDTLHFILQYFSQSLSSFCIPLMYIYIVYVHYIFYLSGTCWPGWSWTYPRRAVKRLCVCVYIYLFCCSIEIMSSNPRLFQPFTWNSVLVSWHIFI